MKRFKEIVFGIMLSGAVVAAAGDICDDLLETEDSLKVWHSASVAKFVPDGGPEKGESAIQITSTDASQSRMMYFRVPIEKVRGKTIVLSAMVKGENISKPPKHHLGIKMMMVVTDANGKKSYPDTTRITGSFDWRKLKTVTAVPTDAKSVSIHIGLQRSSGSIWFSDLELEEQD